MVQSGQFCGYGCWTRIAQSRSDSRDESHDTESILRILCDLAGHVPPASHLLDASESIIQSMASELLTKVAPRSVRGFVEDLIRRSSARVPCDRERVGEAGAGGGAQSALDQVR